MNQQNFETLTTMIRQRWTRKSGVAVTLRAGSENTKSLRICCGSIRNPGIVADTCVVWYGETKVYEGELTSRELRCILTDFHVCHGQLCDTRELEQNRRGSVFCLGCTDTCKRKTCKQRTRATGITNGRLG